MDVAQAFPRELGWFVQLHRWPRSLLRLTGAPAVVIKSKGTLPADRDVAEVGRSSRQRTRQSALERTAVQPKINLHGEPGIFDRCVQLT